MPSRSVSEIGARVSYEAPRRRDNPLAKLEGASLHVRPKLPVQLFAVLDSGERINSEPGFRIDYPQFPAGAEPSRELMLKAIRQGCRELAEDQDRVLLRDILDPLGIEVDLLVFEDLPFRLELDPGLEAHLAETSAATGG